MPPSIHFLLINIILGWLFTKIILPGIYQLARNSGSMTKNYNNINIPNAIGTVFFLTSLIVSILTFWYIPETIRFNWILFLFTLTSFTFLGFMDDLWGSGQCKGFISHFSNLLKGEVTTGSVKALAGTAIALIISFAVGNLALLPLNALIIALTVNTINLFDLRPGRAGKLFLLGASLLIAAFHRQWETVFLAPVAGSLLAYLPVDLKARVMMGDSGANALGAVLGFIIVLQTDTTFKFIYLFLLILLHLVTEKYSLSKIIDKNRILRYLDSLGRNLH